MKHFLTATFTLSCFVPAQAKPPYSGGDTTIELFGSPESHRGEAFSQPAPNLSLTRRNTFFIGNSFFRNPWVTAPASTSARDGLGPVFNSQSCASCHVKDGRGRPPAAGEDMLSMLLRISLAEGEVNPLSGAIDHPVYGEQIQNRAIAGVPSEAKPQLTWKWIKGVYPDGTPYKLRQPVYHLVEPGYGEFPDDLRLSGRVAPAMSGVGLLDTIDDETLKNLEDPDDVNGDGISGRINWVYNVETGKKSIGRFGWKAEQPTVRQQTAAAFVGDIGITSSLFPKDHFTAAQKKRVNPPHGGTPEVSNEILDSVVYYSKLLAIPAQRNYNAPFVIAGREVFHSVGCASCHVPALKTGHDPKFPELSNQDIHPYTDLLLHDMGEELADGRPVFGASGREWRTPPLWGIGFAKLLNLQAGFLHDGRARSLEEAILWHGGEAERTKTRYMQLSKDNRRKLLAFLNSL